ncbi:hypothetical protein GGR57DRAFT_501384 [Xylariaceae sp. FL1272]|nr:hypothetical protein GGR57DRAFT_501384 [Xylariaceae sp. FL1272]
MQFLATLILLIATFGRGISALPQPGLINDINGGFFATCTFIQLHFSPKDPKYIWFVNSCADEGGKQITSTIDLNHCIANDGGRMGARREGRFGDTCHVTFYDNRDSTLKAQCGDGHGGQVDSELKLNDFLSNTNGLTDCYGFKSCPGTNGCI